MKNLKEKGITLIALVVTIVVLLILAGVTIAMLTGENGIINQAKNAKEENKKETAREQLQIALGKAIIDKNINIKYNQYEFLDKIIKEETQEKGETIGDIAIYDGYAFELDRSVPKLGEFIGKKDELLFPEVTASVKNAEDKRTANVTITAKEEKNGINKIEILQEDFVIKTYEYDNVKNEIIENYETNKNGNYYIKVYSKLTGTTIANVEGLIMPVEYSPNGSDTWKKEHSIKINANEEVEKIKSIKYQWTQTTKEPTENSFTESCSNGQTITKNGITGKWYLWTLLETESGAKITGRSEVFLFDNKAPTVTLTSTPVSETSFTLSATGKDNESGIKKYEFYVDNQLKSTQTTNEETVTYNVEDTSMGEYNAYVIVTDIAGNVTKNEVTGKTLIYTWEKWNVEEISVYKLQENGTGTEHYTTSSIKRLVYKSYAFDNKTGYLEGREAENRWVSNWYHRNEALFSMYEISGKSMKHYRGGGINPKEANYDYVKYVVSKESTTYNKGTRRYADVTSANASEYPSNGRSENYWYVYIGIK